MMGNAVFDGEWKLVRMNGPPLPWSEPSTELYRFLEDPLEANDLAAAHPEVVARLEPYLAQLEQADTGLGLNPLTALPRMLDDQVGPVRYPPHAEAAAMEAVTVSGGLLFNENKRAFSDVTGVLQYDERESYGGYVLLSPKDARATYLIDMQGRVVHSWPLPGGQNVSGVARLLDNGNLLRGIKPTGTAMAKSAPGTTIQELDWAGNQVWEYVGPDRQTRPRDDYYRLPNGNTQVTSGQQGHIFEVTPSGEVVWEYVSPVSVLGALQRPLAYPFHITRTSYRFAADHPALIGRDLTPGGTIFDQEPTASLGAIAAAFFLQSVHAGLVEMLALLLLLFFGLRWMLRRRRHGSTR